MKIIIPMIGGTNSLVLTICILMQIATAKSRAVGEAARSRSPATLEKFAAAVLPAIKAPMFTRQAQKAIELLRVLAGFSYRIVRDDLFGFAISNMVNSKCQSTRRRARALSLLFSRQRSNPSTFRRTCISSTRSFPPFSRPPQTPRPKSTTGHSAR
jgi:hypothetical protein